MITVRSLGSLKASIGLAAFRAVETWAGLRPRLADGLPAIIGCNTTQTTPSSVCRYRSVMSRRPSAVPGRDAGRT